MTQKSSHNLAKGLGLAALAGAAAAGYYLAGPGGKKNRTKILAWAKSAQKEMNAKIKEMKIISKQGYDQAAKEILAKYKQAKNVSPEDLAEFGQELKKHWDHIAKQAKNLGIKKTSVKRKAA